MINNYGFQCEEWFLVRTAQDYDMTKIEAKRVFIKSKDSNDFYDRLEQFIKTRSISSD